MKLRWTNTHSRSLEFDSGGRDRFAERLEDAWLDYARPLLPDGNILVFRRTASGSIGAILGDRNWQSQDIWPDLDAIREAIKSRRLYVPSGTTVEYRIVEDANAYRDQVRAAADAYTRERIADVTDSLQDERRTNHDTRTAFPHDSRGTRRDGPGLWI